MVQKGFYYNQNDCIGCHACVIACKVQNQVNPSMAWRKVEAFSTTVNGRDVVRYLSSACHHCADPQCVKVCPVQAFSKREEDGLVVQNHDLCLGCGNCVQSCPYGSPQLNLLEGIAEKCSGCPELVEQGLPPACVSGCPVQVLKMVDLAKADSAGAMQEAVGFIVSDSAPSIRFAPPRRVTPKTTLLRQTG